ncbi:acyl-CoA dehydrogenase family protein [Nocardia asteroides]|uniref:acyl-CoA dehydrogenase family protein n=1 Tax=Nocardia asteroides TaxID=1824 RepID=UPI001E29305C|nr:acyl-CoA dehydrogenase family protein [Nocardia asteroides]UGT55148.1 acyl-CoA/acyl-ACP dehydrogenase [Nocardia asteroides]
MSVILTEEQRAFVSALREFCEREAGTHEQLSALSDERYRGHNPDVYEKLAKLGYVGVSVPEAFGGGGGGAFDLCLMVEEVNRGLLPVAGLGVSMIVAGPYERFGTEAQKKEILGGICAGRPEAIAMSEPDAGSDVANLSTRATLDGDHYVITGQKMWTTAAHVADHLLVVCRTDPGSKRHEGLSMISVPTSSPGLTIRGIDTMGGSEVNEVFFDDVRVPADRLLGTAGNGWRQLMAGLNHERLLCAAQGLGRAQRAFDDVVDYVKTRKQFGQTIGSFQAVRHRIADLATAIESTRHFVYGVAQMVDENPGISFARDASMTKLQAAELAKRATLDAMQMMGGAGYAVEYGMERQVRQAIAITIGGGVSEIQRDIIAKSYGL